MKKNKISENKDKQEKKVNKVWWQPALFMFIRFSGWIIFPIFFALIIGKWLDSKYNSEPLFFLIIVLISFPISILGLIRNVNNEYKKIEKEISVNKKHDSNRGPIGTNRK